MVGLAFCSCGPRSTVHGPLVSSRHPACAQLAPRLFPEVTLHDKIDCRSQAEGRVLTDVSANGGLTIRIYFLKRNRMGVRDADR